MWKNGFIFYLIHTLKICHRFLVEASAWWMFIRNWLFVDQNVGLSMISSNPPSKLVLEFFLASYNRRKVWLLSVKPPSFHKRVSNSWHTALFLFKTSQIMVWHVFTCFLTGFDRFEPIWNSQNFRLFGRKRREKFFAVWKLKFEGVHHTDHHMKTCLQHLKSSNPSRKKSERLCFEC